MNKSNGIIYDSEAKTDIEDFETKLVLMAVTQLLDRFFHFRESQSEKEYPRSDGCSSLIGFSQPIITPTSSPSRLITHMSSPSESVPKRKGVDRNVVVEPAAVESVCPRTREDIDAAGDESVDESNVSKSSETHSSGWEYIIVNI